MKPKYSLCIYINEEDKKNLTILRRKNYPLVDIFRIGMEVILESHKKTTVDKIDQ